MDSEIPPALLAAHPELVAVGEALRQLGEGHPVTATCVKCGKTLVAESVDATGALVIRCPDSHTFFRAKRSVQAPIHADAIEYALGNPNGLSRGRLVLSLQRSGAFSVEYVWRKEVHQRWEGVLVEDAFTRILATVGRTGFPNVPPLAKLVPGTQVAEIGVQAGGEWKRASFAETNTRFEGFTSMVSAVIGRVDPELAYSDPRTASLVASVKRVEA